MASKGPGVFFSIPAILHSNDMQNRNLSAPDASVQPPFLVQRLEGQPCSRQAQ